MKRILIGLSIAMLFLFSITLNAQPGKDVCKVEDGRLVFRLNIGWTDEEMRSIREQYDLDSSLVARALNGEHIIEILNVTWEVKMINDQFIELTKATQNIDSYNSWMSNVILKGLYEIINDQVDLPVEYGINKLEKKVLFQKQNRVTFFLPENDVAKTVLLSGTFNRWSTSQTRMQKTDSGWIAELDLYPGKHLYKYIIDGRWKHDRNNDLKEGDGEGGYNSVYFVYNYEFTLNAFRDAKKVILSGSFNEWSDHEIRMIRTLDGWRRPMYLNDGTHTYKFIVDGNWITDPANPDQMTDGTNNTNSVIRFGEAHTFRLDGFHDATNVYLAGSFNDWDGGEIAMERSFEGWQLNYILAPGTYEYKFVVDGNWISDPANTLKVGKGEFVNSVLYFKSNYTFTLRGFESAERVLISGSFNGWDEWNYQLELKDGIWSFPIYLNNGKHTYKFIVDGEWLLDPGNDLWEENEHGSGNSVLWINP